jgi:N-methylhydantoinase A
MRYVGQGYEIGVPVPTSDLGTDAGPRLRDAFEAEYRRLYGRLIPGLDVEVLSWTLGLTAQQDDRPDAARAVAQGAALSVAAEFVPAGQAGLFDPETGRPESVALYLRAALPTGAALPGPALITEEQTTVVVPRGFGARVLDAGHLLIERLQEAS